MTTTVQTFDVSKGERGLCRGCTKPIIWIITAKGRRMPCDPDGISHFATCPKATTFRKKERVKGREPRS